MKLFIPKIEPEKTSEIYDLILKSASWALGWPIENRQIFAMRARHNGKEYYYEVGQRDVDGEVVLAILESVSYLVITPNRGFPQGHPILVGKNEAHYVEDFDAALTN